MIIIFFCSPDTDRNAESKKHILPCDLRHSVILRTALKSNCIVTLKSYQNALEIALQPFKCMENRCIDDDDVHPPINYALEIDHSLFFSINRKFVLTAKFSLIVCPSLKPRSNLGALSSEDTEPTSDASCSTRSSRFTCLLRKTNEQQN